LQQLGWLAVARAVSEPELDRQIVAAAVEHVRRSCTDGQGAQAGKRRSSYLMELARELVAAPVAQWMQVRSAWAEVLRLAFSYLDLDADGVLSARDLMTHVMTPLEVTPEVPCPGMGGESPAHGANSSEALASACHWVARWHSVDQAHRSRGISLESFRIALMSSHSSDNIFGSYHLEGMSAPGEMFMDEKPPPSFSHIFPGMQEQDEEEISWADFTSRSRGPSSRGPPTAERWPSDNAHLV